MYRKLSLGNYYDTTTGEYIPDDAKNTQYIAMQAAIAANSSLLEEEGYIFYDNGKECGAEANAAKYLGAQAGYNACLQAVMTHGGYGYAKEFHVERYLREVMIARIAPVSEQLILCYIAEKALGLPKSY